MEYHELPKIPVNREIRGVLDRINYVAVHASDLDGIASAALIFLLKPSVKIDYLTVSEALNSYRDYDLVIDLPKIGDAVNIDHHRTNYERLKLEGRLTERDLVDPEAPSATLLVAKYFGIGDNPHVRRIVDIATRADLGQYDDDIYVIDKVIKCNSRDKEKLHRIMLTIALYADKVMKDRWFRAEVERLKPVFEICKIFSRAIIRDILDRYGVEYLIIHVESTVPRICVGDIMHDYIEAGGKIVVLINTMKEKDRYCPSLTENIGHRFVRVSIRSRDPEFDARRVLEMYGGGGHKVAAGARIPHDLLPDFLLFMMRNLASKGPAIYLRINREYAERIGIR